MEGQCKKKKKKESLYRWINLCTENKIQKYSWLSRNQNPILKFTKTGQRVLGWLKNIHDIYMLIVRNNSGIKAQNKFLLLFQPIINGFFLYYFKYFYNLLPFGKALFIYFILNVFLANYSAIYIKRKLTVKEQGS